MSATGKRPTVEEDNNNNNNNDNDNNNRRGVKRQNKSSPLYYTYRPRVSEDKDKAPIIATVDNTNESSRIPNQGNYQRARTLVGEEKWEVAR